MATLAGASLNRAYTFNWVFLIELLTCGVVTLFFLFYLNRFFATVVSWGLRAWTWHKYRVYIDIQAIQISILGGRIFFKGIKYHGNNETILVHEGFITWSYWQRQVRELNLGGLADGPISSPRQSKDRSSSQYEQDGLEQRQRSTERRAHLPCRLNIKMRGVEWFIYNRTPAYDDILSRLVKSEDDADGIDEKDEAGGRLDGLRRRIRSQIEKFEEATEHVTHAKTASDSKVSILSSEKESGDIRNPTTHDSDDLGTKQNDAKGLEDNILLQFLPIHVDCSKAAIVMGNENTKSVLIMKFDKAIGELDATACRSPDLYRQLINFDIEHPVVQMKPNDDYKEDQTTAGMRINGGMNIQPKDKEVHKHSKSFLHRLRRKCTHKLQGLIPAFRSSVESFDSDSAARPTTSDHNPLSHWQGLSRYLDDDEQDDKARWASIDYAVVTTIIDCPRATISYYWDIPGTVPEASQSSEMPENNANINGDEPPGFGLELFIVGGNINYGPWADRQRADLQKVFFPNVCKDAKVAKRLMPGETRIATDFRLYVQLESETTLRIPVREESKNWKWKKQADTMGQRIDGEKTRTKGQRKKKNDKNHGGPEIRPFGWVDVKVAANSTITYTMDMVAGSTGFCNKLEVDIPNTEITTSVNHGLLWRSVDQRVSCDLSNPLEWNGLHKWSFDIESTGLELFILREHIFLLTDLVDDWASGPPPEYLTFTPFQYHVNLDFDTWRLYLNTNDSNIINNPSDFDDNTFLVLFGTQLDADLLIPIDSFRPYKNDIVFKVTANTGGLNLHVPPWNTQATFLANTELAVLKDLAASGKYQYCSTTSTSNTDTLLLDVHARDLRLQLYGFVIRYFLTLKENYFGDHIHFRTLEEYQQLINSKQDNDDDKSASMQPHKKSNDLDVVLNIASDDNCLILPANLYSAKRHIRIEIPKLSLDLRFTNYYMDMQLNLCALAFSTGVELQNAETPTAGGSSTELYIDGVDVYGHRVFGLPPSEPTYICNWDFDVGGVTGECSTDFLSSIVGGIKGIIFSIDDEENALPEVHGVPLHDVTFLRATIKPIRLWLHVDEAAFLLSTDAARFNFDDWAGLHFSKKMRLDIPNLTIACVNKESAPRQRLKVAHPIETHAYLRFTIVLNMVDRKPDFETDRLLQQLWLQREDARTYRSDFLLHPELLTDVAGNLPSAIDQPAMCFPPLPLPIESDDQFLTPYHTSLSSSTISDVVQPGHVSREGSFVSSTSLRRPGFREASRSTSFLAPKGQKHTHNPASRSRSRASRSKRGAPRREQSQSTGRQSSFYSALGDTSDRRGLVPYPVTFASSYIPPYFPLDYAEPDLKDVPDLPAEDYSQEYSEDPADYELDDSKFDKRASHSSFLIDLPDGVRAYCNPMAVEAVAGLVESMQAVNPMDIMDVLQVDTISEVLARKKQKTASSKTTDLRLIVPIMHIRVTNTDATTDLIHSCDVDQYDIILAGATLTFRHGIAIRESSESPSAPLARTAVHTMLRSLTVSAKERLSEATDAQAAVTLNLDDLVFWMASDRVLSANVRLRALHLSTKSRKVEYLAALIHRTGRLAESSSAKFKVLAQAQHNRIQMFTWLVTTMGAEAADPLFLTRPSYVLRSADDHLRATDSWKVITRLRFMYRSLGSDQQHEIAMRCLSNDEGCPIDVRRKVMEGFGQWRSWDLANLQECVVSQRIFGSIDGASPAAATATSAKISIAIDDSSFVLDPGPKQNDIRFATFGADVDVLASGSGEQHEANDGNGVQLVHSTVVKLYCFDTAINLNWELIELAENVFRLYQQSPPIPATTSAHSVMLEPQRDLPSQASNMVHVVIATEKGSITLDSINVRARSISKGLKASVLLAKNPAESVETVSVMLAAEATTTKIKSHSEEFSLSQVRSPSVYLSYEKETLESRYNQTIKVSGTSQEVTFVVRQDAISILELANLVVGDEVAQVRKLLRLLPEHGESNTTLANTLPKAAVVTRVNVALFLDMYHISLPAAHSLTYNVSGVIARASVAARPGAEVIFDFDIQENAHDIQTHTNGNTKSISLLQMPPTNGRMTSHSDQEEHIVSIIASIELIHLDAAAIHNLLTALNRPEILSIVEEARGAFRRVDKHLEQVLGATDAKPKATAPASRPLIYEAHMSLAGLEVFADTPNDKGSHARLSFGTGSIHVEATNRLESHGLPLEHPEVRVGMEDIGFELSRMTTSAYEPCGNLSFAAYLTASSRKSSNGTEVRSYHIRSGALEVNLFSDTASTVVDVVGHLQARIKDIDLTREKQYLQRLRSARPKVVAEAESPDADNSDATSSHFFTAVYSLELLNIQISWIVSNTTKQTSRERDDLVLSFRRIELSTRKENGAKLTIEDLQLQLVPASSSKSQRSENSALLPEMIFNVAYVSTPSARRLAFQAAGKSLDLRLTSQFIIPAAELHTSIQNAAAKVREVTETWATTPTLEADSKAQPRKPFFGTKRMESLLVDADFAGAVVHLTNRGERNTRSTRVARGPTGGRYGQFAQEDAASSTVLRAPGLAWKVEFKDNGIDDASLHAEVKVDASSNILYPTVVPLILEMSTAVQEIVGSDDAKVPTKTLVQKVKTTEEDSILTADPSSVLGRTQLNLGLKICKQDFSLSCQPIARVAATTRIDDVYITVNTVKSSDHGHFFAISSTIRNLQASVQHVYSRESTGSFEVESVVLSIMNSKHTSGVSGMSAILNISPMKVLVNAKQMQDFLLFREIWYPPELRGNSAPAGSQVASQSQTILVQRYQQVAATGAFPWNATVHIDEVDMQLDLGQAIGKSVFEISKLWVSSKKNSDWEQNLCLGFEKIGVDSTGRMSGFVNLQEFRLRTSIRWPEREKALSQTPLIEASVAFKALRAKASFDYQPFLVADITSFEFLMCNVRSTRSTMNDPSDRLIAILDGDAVQVFCTTTTASQVMALIQAFERLIQEKRANYLTSLREIERFMKRKSIALSAAALIVGTISTSDDAEIDSTPVSLHTDVVVTLKQVNLGVFPSTFHDSQILKLEALDAQARFSVAMEQGKIHSALGLTLGQLRIGLAGVRRTSVGKLPSDVSVEDVVDSATSSRGGTILKVPKVEASMETWQVPGTYHIDYIFKSAFEGKVEVGWNYSRISYIRGMYGNHTRALAQRLGKPLPPSAVKITGVPKPEEDGIERSSEQQKITAEVTVPQSKYDYTALTPPIIQTPQLRDMGEATPPLEWIGLHRDRLPNLTHQIVIVTLLEIASEVEDAYSKILGSS